MIFTIHCYTVNHYENYPIPIISSEYEISQGQKALLPAKVDAQRFPYNAVHRLYPFPIYENSSKVFLQFLEDKHAESFSALKILKLVFRFYFYICDD